MLVHFLACEAIVALQAPRVAFCFAEVLLAQVWVDDECGFRFRLRFQDLLCSSVGSVQWRGIDGGELVSLRSEIRPTSFCLLSKSLEYSCTLVGRKAYVMACVDAVSAKPVSDETTYHDLIEANLSSLPRQFSAHRIQSLSYSSIDHVLSPGCPSTRHVSPSRIHEHNSASIGPGTYESDFESHRLLPVVNVEREDESKVFLVMLLWRFATRSCQEQRANLARVVFAETGFAARSTGSLSLSSSR